jgi:RNA polymerase sigma factor (sigma-70 family)
MDSFARQLVAERRGLARAARSQLRNLAWAEDAVSETVLAALEKRPQFDDPQRLRAWLFGVLRHKMTDQLRRQLEGQPAAPASSDETVEALCCDPSEEPPQRAAQGQFLRALDQGLQSLPPAQSQAFLLREAWGFETAEICRELGVSQGNVWVMLCRARASLRGLLTAQGA